MLCSSLQLKDSTGFSEQLWLTFNISGLQPYLFISTKLKFRNWAWFLRVKLIGVNDRTFVSFPLDVAKTKTFYPLNLLVLFFQLFLKYFPCACTNIPVFVTCFVDFLLFSVLLVLISLKLVSLALKDFLAELSHKEFEKTLLKLG